MQTTTEIAIQVCRIAAAFLLIGVLYPYVIYPPLLRLLAYCFGRPWRTSPMAPRVSIIIAAHNEGSVLRAKILNTLRLEYPPDEMEIIVASDCSSDTTDSIALSFHPRVRLVRLEQRAGKQVALNRAASVARGDIFVFTDASVNLDSRALINLTRNFADPQVGAVSSTIRITAEVGPDGLASPVNIDPQDAEGAYLSFDIRTRFYEAHLFSAVGCCGSCYAVRRACFEPFAEHVCNDFASALDAVRKNYRVVVDSEAVGTMLPACTTAGEFSRKSRTIAGGLATLWDAPALPPFRKYPLFWFLLFSHKLARWLSPLTLALLAAVVTLGAILGDVWMLPPLILGAWTLLLSACALATGRLRHKFFPLRWAAFGLTAVAAAFHAWMSFLTGRVQSTWQPTRRHAAEVPVEVPPSATSTYDESQLIQVHQHEGRETASSGWPKTPQLP